jgi:hypothetical protein
MFSVVGCNNFSIRDLRFDGDDLAFTSVWFQGNHSEFMFENVHTVGCKIGWRHGCAYDLTAGLGQYWGYAASPYYVANVYNAPAVGGWQGDTQSYGSCSFLGSLAGFSTESGQNLNIDFNAVLINNVPSPESSYGILMVGGRITANGLAIIRGATYDVWLITGSNNFDVTGFHSESSSLGKIKTSSAASVPSIAVRDADFVNVIMTAGGGRIKIEDSGVVTVTRSDGTSRADIIVENSNIASFAVTNTHAQDLLNISLKNCVLQTAITGLTNTNAFTEFVNCYPITNVAVYGTSWGSITEQFVGNVHRGFGTKTGLVSGAAAVKIGTITTSGNANSGHCLLRIDCTVNTPSVSPGSCFGLYQFAWTTDSGATVYVSAVDVIKESKALHTMATLVPTVTLTVSGANIQIFYTQTNNLAAGGVANIYAEIYSGGITDINTPVWVAV